jgi:hypothetical protein
MLLDEIESYQLHVKKWKIVSHLLIVGFLYYQIPSRLFRKWELNPTSGWVIFYAIISLVAIFSTFRLIKMLFQNGLILEMNERGVHSKEFGFMDWDIIKEIKINKSGLNNTTLLIFMHHPEEFMSTLNISNFKRKIMQEFEKKEHTPFFISISETNYKATDFNSALLKYKTTPSV